jgi:hypothetical protein
MDDREEGREGDETDSSSDPGTGEPTRTGEPSRTSDESTGTDGELPGVGGPREKHVAVVRASGERHEHGDVYLRHATDAFYVSPEPSFPEGETTRYRKAELAGVEITQHHAACFITTATAGEGPTLDALRGFRDDALARSVPGRALVRLYYAVSPPVARTLSRHPAARTTRTVSRLVARCGDLARRRAARDSPVERVVLSTLLTLLYVVGMAVSLGGHLAIRAGERVAGE